MDFYSLVVTLTLVTLFFIWIHCHPVFKMAWLFFCLLLILDSLINPHNSFHSPAVMSGPLLPLGCIFTFVQQRVLSVKTSYYFKTWLIMWNVNLDTEVLFAFLPALCYCHSNILLHWHDLTGPFECEIFFSCNLVLWNHCPILLKIWIYFKEMLENSQQEVPSVHPDHLWKWFILIQ